MKNRELNWASKHPLDVEFRQPKQGTRAAFSANCVSPGGILAWQDEQFLVRYKDHCTSKGMLDAKDITGAIVFLLSDSSCYIVGQNLIVDDGFSI